MLSDEEKKAIKKVKYICDKWYDENLEIDVKWLESLLSLCEKQSKEIEELKKNKGYHLGFIDGGIAKRYEMEDKIKAKIEELKNDMLNENESLEIFYRKKYCNEVLQSLLDKE